MLATGLASLAGRFPVGYAVSAAFVLGFAASAVWRLFRGDHRRIGLQLLAVLAWLGWFRAYLLWVVGDHDATTLRAVGGVFVLAGAGVVAWLRRTPTGGSPPAPRR